MDVAHGDRDSLTNTTTVERRDKGQTGEGSKENRRKKKRDLNVTAFKEVFCFIQERNGQQTKGKTGQDGSLTGDGGGIFSDEKRVFCVIRIIQ